LLRDAEGMALHEARLQTTHPVSRRRPGPSGSAVELGSGLRRGARKVMREGRGRRHPKSPLTMFPLCSNYRNSKATNCARGSR
jgi:hypothetical protein